MRNLKILNLIDIPWNSGLTAYALAQARALRAAGHDILFAACPDTPCGDAVSKAGFEILPVSDRKKLNPLGDIVKVRMLVKKKEIDILNAHTGRTQTMAVLAASGTEAKIIRTKADARISGASFIAGRVSRIIAASSFIRGMYPPRVVKIGKIEVIRPPAPEFDIPPPSFGKPLKMGILARLDPVKGHRYFLETAAILAGRGAEVKFEIGGYESNVTYAELKEYAEKLGISGKVHFYGKVEKPEDFIKRCDIGIISSTGSEAVSRVLMEWMAAGRPVVSTAVGCIPEILGGEFLVPPKRPDRMAGKILEMTANKNGLRQFAEKLKNTLDKKYNFGIFKTMTNEIFRQTADE